MTRRLQPQQQLELDSLYRVATVIAEWYDDLVADNLRGQMPAAMRRAYEDRDLRAMRMAYNDLVEMTRAADLEQRRDLDARLRAAANTNLETIDAKTIQRIERIRARGKITSEEQYHLVREHVEFNFGSPDKAVEVQQLLVILHDFEERSAARTGRTPKLKSDG